MLLLLAGVFSLGGFVLVYVNSADMLRQAAAQAEQWHRMQYYTLETEVLGLMARGEEVTDDALTERAMEIADFGDDGSQSGIWLGNADGMMLFSSLGAAAAEASAGQAACPLLVHGGWYPRRVRAGHCAADKAHDAPAG